MFLLSFALLFAVVTCGEIASAEISQEGKCPAVKLPKDFDYSSFVGVWFEYAKYPVAWENGLDCVRQTFGALNGDKFFLALTFIEPQSKIPQHYIRTGKLLGPGLLSISYLNDKNRTYEILGTDYKSWAVIYNCREDGHLHYDKAWILTREGNPKEETVLEAKKLLFRYSNHPQQLINTRQDGCSYIKI